MLYHDYLNTGLGDITFVREVDEQHATLFTQLNSKDTIEGFNSYLERTNFPLTVPSLPGECQKSLENLSREQQKKDLFKDYVLSWLSLLRAVEAYAETRKWTVISSLLAQLLGGKPRCRYSRNLKFKPDLARHR